MFIQNSYQEMSFIQIASFWYENFVVISIISDGILVLLLLSEIGSTISNLFGGGGGSPEEADKVSSEGSSEETVPEVHCAVVVTSVFVFQ